MDKLISKDELLKVLHGRQGDCLAIAEEMGGEAVIQAETIGDVIGQIESAPVIEDVAPVVHGKWLKTTKWWQGGSAWNACSICKTLNYRSAFCPNCGAKMDGGTT